MTTFIQNIQQRLYRSNWLFNLLPHHSRSIPENKPIGLILIQIDGLSYSQFHKVLRKKRMPFLNTLLTRRYRVYSHYSGLPSMTAAVQGELFYGVPGAVPAFEFYQQTNERLVAMIEPDTAQQVEQTLSQSGKGLLSGGSAYADSYTGGATSASFCASHRGLENGFRHTLPLSPLKKFALYGLIGLRMLALFLLELFLAGIDVCQGIVEKKNFWKEVKHVPYRVGVCGLLREFMTSHVILDAIMGVPIIHCNFLGYDEQAHRRGPSSLFAHWTLTGIDGCIRRIWHAAALSRWRKYEIWIYSDHGQEAAIPYEQFHGQTISTALKAVLHKEGIEIAADSLSEHTIPLQHARLLNPQFTHHQAAGHPSRHPSGPIALTANGPIGHLYLPPLDEETRNRIGQALVKDAAIPAVMTTDGEGKVLAWTAQGIFHLPEDITAVIGSNHPFQRELQTDLIRLVHHPNAGRFVLSGWCAGKHPLNFGLEHGGHAGFGPEETHGFALLPQHVPHPSPGRGILRPTDLRQAVLQFLQQTPEADQHGIIAQRSLQKPILRIMTYNVRHCVGLDGILSPERVAQLIAAYTPDAIALQELDVRRTRSGGIDQAEQIARLLNMTYHFQPSFHLEEGQYGNAIFSHFPLHLVKAAILPGSWRSEPRGAIWVEIRHPSQSFRMIATHLGLRPRERLSQISALLGPHWLAHPACHDPVVLCGDFNTRPTSRIYHMLACRLQDAQITCFNPVRLRTWRGVACLDYIFTTPGISVIQVMMPYTSVTWNISDHFPLIADLKWPPDPSASYLYRSCTHHDDQAYQNF